MDKIKDKKAKVLENREPDLVIATFGCCNYYSITTLEKIREKKKEILENYELLHFINCIEFKD
ncbi:MAG: hypothetical protein ACTSPY_04875 [Candidatus Helarchaeota archaeon]